MHVLYIADDTVNSAGGLRFHNTMFNKEHGRLKAITIKYDNKIVRQEGYGVFSNSWRDNIILEF